MRDYNPVEAVILGNAESFMQHCIPVYKGDLMNVVAVRDSVTVIIRPFTNTDGHGVFYNHNIPMHEVQCWANNRKLYEFIEPKN